MTTLHPTPSRGFFRRIPVWAVVVVAALVGAALIGAGLLLTGGGSGSKTTSTPTPSCTPTAVATPKSVAVNVYNATTRSGLAASTAAKLTDRGFTVETVANDPKNATVAGTAVVRYVNGAKTQARWAAAQVPGATVVKVTGTRTGAKVDLVIGNGFTDLATTAAATTAFASAGATPSC